MRVVPFLATHADMGGTLNEAVDFLEAHKAFVDEVVVSCSAHKVALFSSEILTF